MISIKVFFFAEFLTKKAWKNGKGGRKNGRTLPEALEYREVWDKGIFCAGRYGVSLLEPLSPADHH